MSRKRVAVIGSGFGGLAAALRLQAAGFEVSIFEKRDQPGGRAYVFRDQGFTFDAGPTVITAPETLSELFRVAGRKMQDYVEMIPVDPFYQLFWPDGTQFSYTGHLQKTLEQIQKISPADEKGYLQFLNYTRDVYNEGYVRLAAEPFLNWWSMLKVAPQLARLRADRSVYKTVSQYIQNEKLRQAFSFHSLLVGGNPFSTSSIYTLIHYLEREGGVFFPRGGTGALVQALVTVFEELGGRIYLNSEVEEILTSPSGVCGLRVQGESLKFDFVVSNGDVVHTYRQLLRNEPRVYALADRLEKMRHSMSLFLIYFGTKKKYPQLAHHNVIFGPRYEGLLADIFQKGQLADDFSLYLHVPTRTDPQLAPPDHEAFYVLSPVPHLGQKTVDWSTMSATYGDKILRSLEERLLPGLRDSLVVKRFFTPLDFKVQMNSHLGSAFSLEPLLQQSAYFRTHNRDSRIDGLYFVGAGTHPGAGLPGVLSSAKATCKIILEERPSAELVP